jgi:hypothetical protein
MMPPIGIVGDVYGIVGSDCDSSRTDDESSGRHNIIFTARWIDPPLWKEKQAAFSAPPILDILTTRPPPGLRDPFRGLSMNTILSGSDAAAPLPHSRNIMVDKHRFRRFIAEDR